MKLILSLMLLIASIFMAQSALAMNVQVQEALTPPDTFMVVSAISAPAMTFEYKLVASPVVTLSDNKLSHLNSYIINNTHKKGLYTAYVTAGLRDKLQGVETVLKFPYLIQTNNVNKRILDGLVAI